jgi:hypothetical protein
VLPGCSAASPAARSPSATSVPSAPAAFTFTVAGAHPVLRNGSQDTHVQTPEARCDSATSAADQALGVKVAKGFALASFHASADLLTHFLKGKGTEVDYRAGSPISRTALASSAFKTVIAKSRKRSSASCRRAGAASGSPPHSCRRWHSSPRPATCTGDFAALRA